MKELIDKLSKTCENCKYRGTLSFDYPCSDCLVHEQDNGNLTGCVTFTKFSPKHNDVIHRYLDKLKEERLITDYDIQTMYIDDKPYCTVIYLFSGNYKCSYSFSDLNDKNMVIEIIAECVIKLYRWMANYLMEEIKNDKGREN